LLLVVSLTRTPLVVANWKMYKTSREATAFVREFEPLVRDCRHVEIVLAPPATSLSVVADLTRPTAIGVAAQNLYFEREGAFTGEISAAMIKGAGATWVIVGHSERRRQFGESDEWIARKLRAAVDGGLTPILCIGETLDERERGETHDVLDRQLRLATDGWSGDQLAGIALAYEPVWAIGTGRNATPAEAGEAHRHLRSRVREWFGASAADACRMLYGGSVKPDNAAGLLALPDVDGALVGGASLDPAGFAAIVRAAPRRSRA
jgi:triosephosphate isomerase